jgi:hypothetical protein
VAVGSLAAFREFENMRQKVVGLLSFKLSLSFLFVLFVNVGGFFNGNRWVLTRWAKKKKAESQEREHRHGRRCSFTRWLYIMSKWWIAAYMDSTGR